MTLTELYSIKEKLDQVKKENGEAFCLWTPDFERLLNLCIELVEKNQ